ncbi:efflux RND transporter permease subunit [bacterium]|nr:MAG: efflux RND transporter permease subunit [bacterium]
MWLTRFAIQRPTIVTLFFLAIALFGTIGYFSMGENIMPNVTFPFVGVSAGYPGASPQEMERLVVKPIEDQLQSVQHVQRMTGFAQDGTAFIGVQFKLGTDINAAQTDVQNAVDSARPNLPSDLVPPSVQRFDPSSQPIVMESIGTSTLSPVALGNLVQNTIVADLRSVQGVGSINVGGAYTRQITVEPQPGSLLATGATLLDVDNAVSGGNVSLPGGRLDQSFRESTVGVRADITSAQQIAQLPLAVPGGAQSTLRVGDVARVVDGYADQRILQTVNGDGAVIVQVARDSDGDTARTTRAVRAEFKSLAQRYPQLTFRELNADSDFMHQSIDGVLQNLFEGIVLTAVVLLFFLHVWRSAIVVMIAIPTSLLATFFVMWQLGFTVDVLSLMGLSLTIGILVDDSIVVIENITRHRDMGKSPDQAAVDGRSEIGGAAIAITLVDVVVFTPIAFMSGIVGEYMREFGLVVVCATLFSLLVSFTLTPLLAAKWAVLKKSGLAQRHGNGSAVERPTLLDRFTFAFERSRAYYHDQALPWALRHPWMVVLGSLGLVLASFVPVAVQLVPFEFQPATEWGQAIVGLQYPPGTPIATTEAGAMRLTKAFMKMKGVRYVNATVGEYSDGYLDKLGGHVATISVILYQNQRHQEHVIVEQAPKLAYLVPGARIAAGGAQNGGSPAITYVLTGPTEGLSVAAGTLAAFIAKNPVASDVQTSNEQAGPRLEIQIDRGRAAMLGISPQAAAETARAAVGGVIATKVRMPEGLIDTLVQLPPRVRDDVRTLQGIDVRSSDGTLVPLVNVASFAWSSEPPLIQRQDRHRIVRVTANTKNDAPIGLVTSSVDRQLATPGFLPPGVTVTTLGDAQNLSDATSKIGYALLTSFLLIYMLLVILYGSYLEPLVIMFSIPVAIVGALGILAVANAAHKIVPGVPFFAGQTLNLFSMLGIVMLMGLVAKNGILLVDYADTLRKRGLGLREAIRESASIRFRPIVMTTVSMIAGMLPLAMGFTEGAEFRKSMGTVIIGGLTSSLFLTLFLVPVVYIGLVGLADRRREAKAARLRALHAREPELELPPELVGPHAEA